jgi:hypothetical protein
MRGSVLGDIFPGAPPLRVKLADLDLEDDGLVSAFDGALREEGLTGGGGDFPRPHLEARALRDGYEP